MEFGWDDNGNRITVLEEWEVRFVEDAKDILGQLIKPPTEYNDWSKVSKTELVKCLRGGWQGWTKSSTGRCWKLSAWFINRDMDEVLELGGVTVLRSGKHNRYTHYKL